MIQYFDFLIFRFFNKKLDFLLKSQKIKKIKILDYFDFLIFFGKLSFYGSKLICDRWHIYDIRYSRQLHMVHSTHNPKEASKKRNIKNRRIYIFHA